MINQLKLIIFLGILTSSLNTQAQEFSAFESDEYFKFRIHYGWFNASYATLSVKDQMYEGREVYHVRGRGKSTGLLHLFFEVDDDYQTFIDKESKKPVRFIRKINEGGHTKNKELFFDHEQKTVLVHDKKYNKKESFDIKPNVQDMLSVFYYLREKIDRSTLQKGDDFKLNLFFDNENYLFKTVFLGRDRVKTKFGYVQALKFRPYVQAGRVFEEEESLTFWVSDDENKAPIKIKAKLAVGSLEADLEDYKNLKHPIQFQKR
ncbi:DUF3108 domain-containing protein [Mesonia sp. HuA40]|uniref:DUF3108 domain-containing protein n=1 Tax=Mesonia sp. HuA40 TaxID=2602761 RepID=UPI0011CC71A3|nr:DUF3108 domain-containing protein [Mesonia sp. HuA40]TXK72454.1 DUF3108 domain-containing protein [Mesonia sp. HuA40]